MLAAIVFTDVVGYSVLAGRDEGAAISAFRRDSELITQLCQKYGGQVLKGTGDGLLLCFTSAVEAVNCSIAIQEAIHDQALTGSEIRLQHRIGVHLGDVVVLPDDVIGDGVNVAARIQNEAKPGGIALSQTVYDVVKGKTKLNASCLGVRHLKHIVEPITVWQLAPAGFAEANAHNNPTPQQVMLDLPPPQEEEHAGGTKGLLIALCAVVVLLVPIVIWLATRDSKPTVVVREPPIDASKGQNKAPSSDDKTGTGESKTGESEGKKGDEKASPQKPTDEEKPANPETNPGTGASPSGTAGTPEIPKAPDSPVPPNADEDEPTFSETDQDRRSIESLLGRQAAIREAQRGYKATYDFAGFAKWLDDQGYSSALAGRGLAERYRELARFKEWLKAQIASSSSGDPLILRRPNGAELGRVWSAGNDAIVFSDGGSPRAITFEELAPRQILDLTFSISQRERQDRNRVGGRVVRNWATLFAREYGLPIPRANAGP